MADLIYNSFRAAQLGDTDIDGTPIDLDGDTLKLALVTSSYSASTAHVYYSDITNEVVGDGYTAGGAALAGKAITYSGGTATFDANDVSWGTSTITARGGVLYKVGAGTATSPLIAYFDFGSDKSSSSGTFQVTWAATGILTLA